MKRNEFLNGFRAALGDFRCDYVALDRFEATKLVSALDEEAAAALQSEFTPDHAALFVAEATVPVVANYQMDSVASVSWRDGVIDRTMTYAQAIPHLEAATGDIWLNARGSDAATEFTPEHLVGCGRAPAAGAGEYSAQVLDAIEAKYASADGAIVYELSGPQTLGSAPRLMTSDYARKWLAAAAEDGQMDLWFHYGSSQAFLAHSANDEFRATLREETVVSFADALGQRLVVRASLESDSLPPEGARCLRATAALVLPSEGPPMLGGGPDLGEGWLFTW
ncbi:hypothetical protein FHS85_002327 [Rhodoligotrophos appendicifer]|uniref:hypothetical protein n=1 Tax=Rhodoligotrophos appendicifer TaxID=987056 RepID=UPI001184E92B|nr:hypothetical protein [Rhodoligotrophos appendicifer]